MVFIYKSIQYLVYLNTFSMILVDIYYESIN